MEQKQETSKRATKRTIILGVIFGVFIGWFLNDRFSSHYVLHRAAEGPTFRIDSRNGTTWILHTGQGWIAIPEAEGVYQKTPEAKGVPFNSN